MITELTLWALEPDFKGLCKQFGSRWDATERGVSSGSKLFAILIVVFEKSEENDDLRTSADDILADDKFPSMQRVNRVSFDQI